MKPVYGVLFIVFLLSFRISYGQKENNSVLDKQITLEAKNETVAALLDRISSQAQVFFSYDASLIDADKKTTLSISDKTIRETLDVLFESKFDYQTLGDQIIITKPEGEDVKKKKLDSLKKNQRLFSSKGR